MLAKISVLGLAAVGLFAGLNVNNRTTQPSQMPKTAAAVSGDYIEVRTCDVFTGPCFANGEMGLAGKEAIMAWSIKEGEVDGVNLAGLHVIAVVKAEDTLTDVSRFPEPAQSVVIVDAKATPAQREALVRYVQKKAGNVLGETVQVQASPVKMQFPPTCSSAGCSNVEAGDLVQIQTRCIGDKDHFCGNEELFYPPLTDVQDARPAFTLAAVYHGTGLDTQFDQANRRSAYLATFAD